MRNLKPYEESDFDFHQNVIRSKNNTATDPDYKTRLNSYNPAISQCFDDYRNCFATNSLVNLAPKPMSLLCKNDLMSLYSYRSSLIQRLKVKLTTSELNRIINTCQNCTINEINSFDHYVPKEEYSEYIVNPINLLPSCTQCNSYKGIRWKENNSPLFLNLYLDTLPQEQYLFADINIVDGIVDVNFKLDNPNNIDNSLFLLIKSHYTKLHLLDRFKLNVDLVITPLRNTIETNKEDLPINEIVRLVTNTSEANRRSFGYNYWKSILELSLVNNQNFLNSI